MGVDGRWTAWRGALAARLGVCLAAEGRGGGSVKVRLRGLWLCGFLFLWRKVEEAVPPNPARSARLDGEHLSVRASSGGQAYEGSEAKRRHPCRQRGIGGGPASYFCGFDEI
jgi:hypothetical protein